ncbi:histidinol-phosphate transaminase [Enterobacteriaceae endosymbiont of Macroplea appendiculata]|uniref:histidinol-phosphate transaminase n=1 Tax=Enterobacteriaceae endosymbiont of Macroplea appendiculata TaxID=2675790 RepID=UPI001FE2BBB9|nr:histidinol-phosphate transaminase [Enterobacteriaceae endosymbiont of Macroplea appendiculata]
MRKKYILQNKLLHDIVKTNKHFINKIVRHDIINLLPYQSARLLHNTQCRQILLNANESPKNHVFHLKVNTFNRYPEPQPQKLKFYYMKYININININNILITRGADEGIELIMRTFCIPYHDAIMFCPPTYGMYQINAQILGVKYYTVKCLCNFQLNLKKIIHKINNYNIKIIYICNPNNPTGNLINKNDIIKLLKFVNNNIIIVLDEAYIEFCHTYTLLKLITQYNNVIVLRTLSKAFGLAGLRCGFIIAYHSIIHTLKKVIAPYPIPQPVSDIAVQALHSSYISIVFDNIKNIIANREWLIRKLKYLNIVKHIYPSVTNYILVEFINVQHVFNYLLKHNIIVRQQNQITQLKNCLRITIGTYHECKQIIVVLQQLLIQ